MLHRVSGYIALFFNSLSRPLIIMAGGGGASSGAVAPPLNQAFGYGIVVGLGFLFAFGMILTTWVLKR